MAQRDDDPLSPGQIDRYAKNGSDCPARMVRSMAQELQRRREWDAPPPAFPVSSAERAVIEGIRAMMNMEAGGAKPS